MHTKLYNIAIAAVTVLPMTLVGCADDSAPVPAQLETATFHGDSTSAEVAQQAVAGVVTLISGFKEVMDAGGLDGFLIDSGEVYAGSAQIFQSQEFMGAEQVGPEAFVYMLDFLYTELGEGQEALQPLEVCEVYVYRPDAADSDTIEWVMTSQTIVPSYGTLIATARMTAVRADGQWRLTYHDYADAPAPGEDCAGAQVQKVRAEWLCVAEPDGPGC